jgi:hypothetical protein
MQEVPTISTALWNALGEQAQRPNVLVEIYENDILPGAMGFDPDQAILRIANTHIADFLGNEYLRYLEPVGTINRTITEKFNTVSIKISNPEEPPGSFNRPMAAFVLGNSIEGMFIVIRLISRAVTATSLADSFVVFTGKLEKPYDSEGNSITLSARQYIGNTEQETPWREFDPEDEEGRLTTDPLFEGFLYSAKNGSVSFNERVRRGGFIGLLGFKKTVARTLPFSNHQGVEISKAVPVILGRAQVPAIPVAYIDAGAQINVIYNISEGPIKKFFDQKVLTQGYEFASVHDSNPNVDQFRYGYAGNTNGQVLFLDNLTGGIPGNGYYSMSAMFSTAFYGTEVAQDDPAPEATFVILGMIIPVPDSSGEFTLAEWSDNPSFQVRWALTHPHIFNLDPAFINDPQCIKTACYCDDPVLDNTNGELILLPSTQEASYGTAFRRYHSTGLFTPEYFLHYFLGVGQDPLPELILPTEESGIVSFFDASSTVPVLDILSLVRRRFTSNIYLSEKMKSIDFLFEVLLPAFRGYLVQTAQGKIDIKCKRPADNTIIRSASIVGATEIAVNTVLPWAASLNGEVIVGNDLLTSEVRAVTGYRFTTAANSITLAVSGSLSASGATLTGGTNGPPGTPATGSLTVTGLGTLSVTIDGRTVSYTTQASDTTGTAAAMLTQFLKADPTFQTYLKFAWSPDTPNVISIQSKIGFLTLAGPALQHAHSIAEEVLRIQMSFSDRLYTPADRLNSNIIQGSFKWPLGSRRSSKNRVVGTFVDSPQDFQAQKVRTRDDAKVARLKKTIDEEIGLTGVDSFSQAKRLELSKLAEIVDLDFFMQHTSDRRAMLLEEGDLICNTHASGGFRNVALRVEEVSLDLSNMTVDLLARRYSTSAYLDEAPARNVPLPTTLLGDSGPPAIAFDIVTYPPFGLSQTTDSEGITSVRGGAIFGSSVFAQTAKVSLKRPLETEFTQITTITPDGDMKAVFEFVASEEGTYTVQLEVCFVGGACNATKPTAEITVAFGALGVLLTEAGGILLTESGDYLAEG